MKQTVFVGTYTEQESKGIYTCQLDTDTGMLADYRLAAETPSPSFLALHPNRRFVYAVNEAKLVLLGGSGAVTAFAIPDSHHGSLVELNSKTSHGSAPCHIAVSASGKSAIVANYDEGTVSALEILNNGSLGETLSVCRHTGSSVNPERQEAPHPHAITLDPAGKFVFVPDLGMDQILKYEVLQNGGMGQPEGYTQIAPGSGPRHFVFHPSGKYAYVINELLLTITAFSFAADEGTLTEIQTISSVPVEWTSGIAAEIALHPSGKFLYGSNRGHDSIACYQIDQFSGTLTLCSIRKTRGKTPRSFNIDPSGKWLLAANQESCDLRVFGIDQETGDLTPSEGFLSVPCPVCVVFL